MNKKEKLAFAVVAALAMTSGGFAFGQSVNTVSSDQVIYACVTGINGNITKVSNTQKTCPKGTTPISWNMVGPKGDQGIKGEQGSQGQDGAQGPIGQSGAKVYLKGPSGESFPIIYTPIGSYLQIGEDFWAWDDPNRQAHPVTRQEEFVLYKTGDCSSIPYLATKPGQDLAGNSVISLAGVGSDVGQSAFSAKRSKSTALSDFRSFKGFGDSACRVFDSSFYTNSLKKFGNLIRANANQISEDFLEGGPQHRALFWDYSHRCGFDSIYAPNNSFRKIIKSYNSPFCHLIGDIPQSGQSVLNLYSIGKVYFDSEQFYWNKTTYDSSGQHFTYWMTLEYETPALNGILSVAEAFESAEVSPGLGVFELTKTADAPDVDPAKGWHLELN
jgi:hypothetical protein